MDFELFLSVFAAVLVCIFGCFIRFFFRHFHKSFTHSGAPSSANLSLNVPTAKVPAAVAELRAAFAYSRTQCFGYSGTRSDCSCIGTAAGHSTHHRSVPAHASYPH